MRRMLVGAAITLSVLTGCGDASTDTSDFRGARWVVDLVRLDTDEEWTRAEGFQEWWFFKSGVFRQVSEAYVEPQFYGALQSCTGVATGLFEIYSPDPTEEETESQTTGLPSSAESIELTYDAEFQFSGLCRLSNRVIHLAIQPTGDLDILDNRRVQRLRRQEAID